MRASTTSTRFPGRRKPATPTTSFTGTVIARIVGDSSAASVLPWEFLANCCWSRISPGSSFSSATRPTTSLIFEKWSPIAVPLGRVMTRRWRASTLRPKGISVAATTACMPVSALPPFRRACIQLRATHAAPRASTRETMISVDPRRLSMTEASGDITWRCGATSVAEVDEVVLPSPLEGIGLERVLRSDIGRMIQRHVDQVAGMAGQQRDLRGTVQKVDDSLADRGVVGDPMLLAHLPPDTVILLRRQCLELNLVADAPKEGLIGEVSGLEVGREHEDQIEQGSEVL